MLGPERVWLPPEITILPVVDVLLMMPDRSPVASVIVSRFVPNAVLPFPDKVLTLAPDVSAFRALMSKLPLLLTPLELAIEPEPDSAKVPALMVVTPEKILLTFERVIVPVWLVPPLIVKA